MLAAEVESGLILHNVHKATSTDNDLPLARLLTGLDRCGSYEEQIALVLNVVVEATRADFCFFYRENGGVEKHVAVYPDQPMKWCVQAGELLLSRKRVDSLPPLPYPCEASVSSVASIRISKRKRTWLIAVGLDPEKPIVHTDVQNIRLARQIWRNHRRQTILFESLKSTLFGLINGLTKTLEAKDKYTGGHSERVARIAVRISQQMQLPAQQVGDIYLAGLLHDIGKIGIRDDVLAKAGPLTKEEYEHVQEHPVIGHTILAGITQLEHLIPGVRGHHERIDGKGYPDGLAGTDIHLMARILAVADAFDAMMSPRPYRSALPASVIMTIMREGAGSQWDARVVDAFFQCDGSLFHVQPKGIGDSVFAALDRHLTDHSIHFGHQ